MSVDAEVRIASLDHARLAPKLTCILCASVLPTFPGGMIGCELLLLPSAQPLNRICLGLGD